MGESNGIGIRMLRALRLVDRSPAAHCPLAQGIRPAVARHERAYRLAEGETVGESNGGGGGSRTG